MQIIQINRHENTNHAFGQIHEKHRKVNLIHFLAAKKLVMAMNVAKHGSILAFFVLKGKMVLTKRQIYAIIYCCKLSVNWLKQAEN